MVERKGLISFSVCGCPVFPRLFIEETALSHSSGNGTMWKIIWACVEGFIWGVSVLFHGSMRVYFISCSSVICFEIGIYKPPTSFSRLFSLLGVINRRMNFFLLPAKNAIGILMWIALNVYITLGVWTFL